MSRNNEYINGKMTTNNEVNFDLPNDKNTFDIVQKIGDEIHESIKLVTDVPSNHDDRKVPILDLKCWIAEVKTNTGTSNMILHEHYVKEVSSKMVLHREAAMSISNKRIILTQECLRIILNCNTHIGWKKIAEHLTFFMSRMQASGYDHQFRLEILKSAINAHDKITREECEWKKIYKRREWRRNERRQEREKRKKNWYSKGGYKSVYNSYTEFGAKEKITGRDK